MLSDEDIEIIEGYQRGILKDDVLRSFESRRMSDPAFNKEVEAYGLIMQGIRALGEQAFAEKVTEWESEVQNRKKVLMVPLRIKALAIAATILILIVPFTVWISHHDTKPTSTRLFDKYFYPYDDIISQRSTTGGEEGLQKAMSAYDAGKYRLAIIEFKKILTQNPKHEGALFYQGISFLIEGQTKEAEKNFLYVTTNKGSIFPAIAEWYLLLIYAKENRAKEMEFRLNNILSDRGHPFYEKAKSLDQDIN
jgi:hypothetical protein